MRGLDPARHSRQTLRSVLHSSRCEVSLAGLSRHSECKESGHLVCVICCRSGRGARGVFFFLCHHSLYYCHIFCLPGSLPNNTKKREIESGLVKVEDFECSLCYRWACLGSVFFLRVWVGGQGDRSDWHIPFIPAEGCIAICIREVFTLSLVLFSFNQHSLSLTFFRLFYHPVTTPCGHTFCRGCLYRSLDYSNGCPLCKGCLAQVSRLLAQY